MKTDLQCPMTDDVSICCCCCCLELKSVRLLRRLVSPHVLPGLDFGNTRLSLGGQLGGGMDFFKKLRL